MVCGSEEKHIFVLCTGYVSFTERMAQYALDVQTALWRVLATDEAAAAMTELSANNCRSGTVHGARADIAGSIMCVACFVCPHLPAPTPYQGRCRPVPRHSSSTPFSTVSWGQESSRGGHPKHVSIQAQSSFLHLETVSRGSDITGSGRVIATQTARCLGCNKR